MIFRAQGMRIRFHVSISDGIQEGWIKFEGKWGATLVQGHTSLSEVVRKLGGLNLGRVPATPIVDTGRGPQLF